MKSVFIISILLALFNTANASTTCTSALDNNAHEKLFGIWQPLVDRGTIGESNIEDLINKPFRLSKNVELAEVLLNRDLDELQIDALSEIHKPEFFIDAGVVPPEGYGLHSPRQLRLLVKRLNMNFHSSETNLLIRYGIAGQNDPNYPYQRTGESAQSWSKRITALVNKQTAKNGKLDANTAQASRQLKERQKNRDQYGNF